MKIYPSILESTPQGLESLLHKYHGIFDTVQIDIVDGVYRPQKTVQMKDVVEVFDKNKQFYDFQVEFHLMVEKPELIIDQIVDYGKFHIKDILFSVTKNIKAHQFSGLETGVVFESKEMIEDYFAFAKQFSHIQLMTVESGRQGNPFLPEVLAKTQTLREMGYTGEIILDGGINDATLTIIRSKQYLPDAVCPGSWLKNMTKDQLVIMKTS